MNFIKIAKRDISSIFRNRLIRISVTAIIIVPLLYSLLYLYAFWDPYSRLSQLPVAVVNQDKGSTKDGENVNYGKDMVDKLKDNNKVGWKFVSKEEAESGVKGSKYYAMFIVPEDFSAKVLSAKNGKPEQPDILYTANEKRNFLASQINGKVLVELKAELTKNIVDEYTKVTFDNLYDVKDGMQKASDGSKELYDGVSKLNDKVPELKDGVNKLNDGSAKLKDGLGQAQNGTAQLYYGADKLNSALGQAKDGANQVYSGLGQLNSQIPDLKDGVSKLYVGSSDLNNGLGQINTGVKALNDAVNTTAVDSNGNPVGLVNGVNTLGSGISSLNSAVNTTAADSNGNPLGLAKGVDSLNTAINTAVVDSHGNPLGLAKGMNALNTAVNTSATDANGNPLGLAAGINTMYSEITKPQVGLADGVAALYSGLTKTDANPANAGIAQNLQTIQALLNAGDATSIATAKVMLAGLVTTTSTHSADPLHPTFLDGLTALNNAVNVSNTNVQGKAAPSLKTAITVLNDAVSNSYTVYNPGISLKDAVTNLNTGINVATMNSQGKPGPSLKAAVATINAGINTGSVDASGKPVMSLSAALNTMNASVNGVTDASGNLVQAGLVQGVNTLGTTISGQLMPGVGQAYDGSAALKLGLTTLNGNVPNLAYGVTQLYAGSGSLESGLSQIYSGSAQLRDNIAKREEVKNIPEKDTTADTTLFAGVSKLYDGSSQLHDGTSTLNGNIPELQDGVSKLYDGSKELSDKLKDGSDKINKNLINDSKTMAQYVSEPLKIDEEAINPVKNYGTGFTPYFVPLSLWVGAIMMFFVITEKIDDDIDAGPASLVVGKFLSYGFIGLIQAVLASTIVLALGLKPNNVILYYLFNIFLSYVFIAIIQSLIFLLGQAGRLLSIILLILQLTACAGTFPLEVVPKFFKVINPIMPFTYAVSGLREVISGVDYSVFLKDVSVLAAIMIAFVIISVLMKEHADKVQSRIKELKGGIDIA